MFKIEPFSVKHVWLRGAESFSTMENCKRYGWEMNVSATPTDVYSHKHLDTVLWCQLSGYFRIEQLRWNYHLGHLETNLHTMQETLGCLEYLFI